MKYTVYTRHQYYNSNAEIVWSKWYICGLKLFMRDDPNDPELISYMKEKKEGSKDIVKSTKLKIDYKIDEIDDTTIPHYTKIPVPLNEWCPITASMLKTPRKKKK